MRVITLTTDLGTKDHYVASLKGAIYMQFPAANIVDISHEVQPFDILQASFLVKNCYRDFPAGTIHVIGMNAEWTPDSRHLIVIVDEQYFIGADNGIFSLIFDKTPDAVYELTLTPQGSSHTFPTRDIYARAASHLAKDGSLQIISKETNEYEHRGTFTAVPEPTLIRGMAIYIDHYGNVISNITEQMFRQYNSTSFRVILRREDYDITTISKTYGEVPEGERLALFSSSGYLEIAINRGNASKLLGIKQNDIIRIEFYDQENR